MPNGPEKFVTVERRIDLLFDGKKSPPCHGTTIFIPCSWYVESFIPLEKVCGGRRLWAERGQQR